MTLLNPTCKPELTTRLDYLTAWLSSHRDDYTENGQLDTDALADALAENFGILRDWARELVEQYRAGKEGAK